MKVYVIIVTYNASKWIDKCFLSLRNSSLLPNTIVIDNGSVDGSADIITSNYPEVEFIQSKQNLGFGKGNNIGIQKAFEAGADYVFLLNQDAWLDKDALEKLVMAAENNLQYGILSPIQMNGDASGLDLNFSKILHEYGTPGFLNDLYIGKLKPLYPTNFVMAAMWLITKRCYATIGLFEPLFPHYGEDSDYINRAIYHGFNVGICTEAVGYHDRGKRLSEGKKTKVSDIYINFLVTGLNVNTPTPIAIRTAVLGLLKSQLHYILKADFTSLKYLAKGLASLPKIADRRKKNRLSLTGSIQD